MYYDIPIRPRRNRRTAAIRALVQESHLQPHQLVAPYFVVEGHDLQIPIASMPGVFRWSLDRLLTELETLFPLGIRSIALFCYIPEAKRDAMGSEATRAGNLLQHAIRACKEAFPELIVMADIALDPYTSHGHDGLVSDNGTILNDPTIAVLCDMSLRAAEAGVDFIAPSDMMDGRIGILRRTLDQHGFIDTGILSYAVKYASSFYAPFRDALDSSPKFGDKKGYQMNPANSREALLECALDAAEGADLLLIKPGLPCLDVIASAKAHTHLPIGAYQVSGEYAMIKAAAAQGWLREEAAIMESLLSIRRAGADFILTYAAKQAAQQLAVRV